VTVVVPKETPPTSDTLSWRNTSSTIPGVLVSSAASLTCATIIDPDNVVATAMAVWVSVLYEFTDATDTVTMICAPVAWPAEHLTYMAVLEFAPSAIVVVAYVA